MEEGTQRRVNLLFGEHDLRVFNRPEFKHLQNLFPYRREEGGWRFFPDVEGRGIKIAERTAHGHLLQVMRNPVGEEQDAPLLVLRKDDPRELFGTTRLLKVYATGTEIVMGKAIMSLTRGNPHIETVAVNAHLPKGEHGETAEMRRLKELLEKAKRSRKTTLALQIHSAINSLYQTKFSMFAQSSIPPEGSDYYSYRKRGLGGMLFALQEELAEKSGHKRVTAVLDKLTSYSMLRRRGWRPIAEARHTNYLHCEKKL